MSVVVFAFEDKDGNTYRAAGAIAPLQREEDRAEIRLHDDGTPELGLKMTGHQVVTDATFGDIVLGAATGLRLERLYCTQERPTPLPDPETMTRVNWRGLA